MSTPATARDILATAARKTPGEVTTLKIDGKRLAIVDADWLEAHKAKAATDAIKVRLGDIFGKGFGK